MLRSAGLVALALLLAAATPAPRGRRAAEIARLRGEEAAAQPRFAAQRARLSALNAEEQALAARIGANRTSLERLLSALEAWRRDPPPALLVSPARARDAARAAILMRAIEPELQRRARVFADQARALARVRRQAAEAGAQLFAAESAAADRRARIDALAHGAPLDSALASPSERAAMAQARGDPMTLGSAPTHGPPAPPPSRLLAPVRGPLVRRFGQARPEGGRSEGAAWAAAPDAPVLAPADGEVEYAGPLKDWRLVVILRLAGDWRVVLAGLQSVSAPVGAAVRAGEPLGRSPPASRPPAQITLQLRHGAEPADPGPALAAAASR